MDEKTLIRRCQDGDREAFRTVVESHRQAVFSLAFRMLCYESAAKDIVQETFIRAWQGIRRPLRRWAVAASVAIIFCLGATAAGAWLAFSENSECSENSETSEVSRTTAAKPDFFVFDNVELQQVAAILGKHYHLKPVFENEAAMRKRIYMKVNKQKTIKEVVELLNELDEFTVTVSEGKQHVPAIQRHPRRQRRALP